MIGVPAGYNLIVERCDTAEARDKIERALQILLNRPVSVRFERSSEEIDSSSEVSANAAPTKSRDEDLEGDPIVRKVVELFEARRLHTEYDDDPPRSPAG